MYKYLFLLSVSVLGLSSCKRNITEGHGVIVTENRSVSAVTSIEIEAPVKAEISIGGQPACKLEGYENLVKLIKTEIQGNTLRIYLPKNTDMETDKDVIAYITLPSLTLLTLTGSPDANIHNKVEGANLKIDISGSSDVVIDQLSVQNFSTVIAGSGSITVSAGVAYSAKYEISGSGDVSCIDLQTNETSINISGSGDAEVNVSGKLNVSLAGSGSVVYKGHPVISQNITGSGTVEEKDSTNN